MNEDGSSDPPKPRLFDWDTLEIFKEHFPRSKHHVEVCMEWRKLSLEDKCIYERMGMERLNEMQNTMHKMLEYMKENHFPQFINTTSHLFSSDQSAKGASICSYPINQEAEIVKRTRKMVHSHERLKITESTQEECFPLSWRRWKDLDPNLLKRIFLQVPIHDLLFNVSSVCQSWQLACWDFLFWCRNVLDLSATDAGFHIIGSSTVYSLIYPKAIRVPGFFGQFESEELYNKMAVNLMKLLWNIMEGDDVYGQCLQGWRLSLQTIIIPRDLQIADTHLLFIAERSPCINQLYLLGTRRLTVRGFGKAVRHWKHVKHVHLSLFDYDKYAPFIEEMGRNCPELEYLYIYQERLKLDEANALVIAKNLPRVKKLGFSFSFVYTQGIVTLVKMCPELEEIHFDLCFRKLSKVPSDADVKRRIGAEYFVLSWTTNVEGYVKWHVRPIYDLCKWLPSTFIKWMDGSF